MVGMNHSRQWKGDILRLALLLGLCSAIGTYLIFTTVLITKDGVFYIEQARQFALDPGGVCRRYPPGYPFLIWASHEAASLLVRGDSPTLWAVSAQAITLLCRVLTLIPLYFLGRLLVGAANSFWALLVLVILPYPAFYGSDVLREWPYLLFLSTGMLLLYQAMTTRRWWLLALVGFAAGLGYLIRPECVQLIVYALLGWIVVRKRKRGHSTFFPEEQLAGQLQSEKVECPLFSSLLLVAGFVVPAAPYVYANGSVIPHQFRPWAFNRPPVISMVGSQTATSQPLEFDVCAGSLMELPIRATDPDGDRLTISLVGVPVGSRPVHEFRLITTGALFWTISDYEKEQLITVYPEAWDYEGIAWYAYTRPDAAPGLQPVYRFWSSGQQRHFYTMSESEKEAALKESTPESWTCEGAVFHAFAEEGHPADAVAVRRFLDREGAYTWGPASGSQAGTKEGTIAWYAHPAGEPPSGAAIKGKTFRWRPRADQQGIHQVNIVATDGKLACCQLLIIRVVGAASVGQDRPTGRTASIIPSGASRFDHVPQGSRFVLGRFDPTKLAAGIISIISAIGDDFMFLPVLPWILGLYGRFKDRTRGGLERILLAAVLIINVGLMLGRSTWLATGSDRRYSLAMIALTIFYLPAGLDVIARVLNRVYTFRGRPAACGSDGGRPGSISSWSASSSCARPS